MNWINVTDRLPSDGARVLAIDTLINWDGSLRRYMWVATYHADGIDDGRDWHLCREEFAEHITHWTALPEMPDPTDNSGAPRS